MLIRQLLTNFTSGLFLLSTAKTKWNEAKPRQKNEQIELELNLLRYEGPSLRSSIKPFALEADLINQ